MSPAPARTGTRRRAAPRARIGPLTPHLFRPSAARPLRAKNHSLAVDTEVVPHRHPWGQLAYSAAGVVRLTVADGTYLAPPTRAVWVPPGVEHAVTVVEAAELRTLYLHPDALPGHGDAAWQQCRVLEVSALLRALVLELSTAPDGQERLDAAQRERERLIGALIRDELNRARPVPLGVDLPADKRLRSLCLAVLDDPARHGTLDDWARDVGASPRTLTRLFRDQLGTSFGAWRQQVLLARALALAARGRPIALIAADLGYASASAFTAMVRRTVGQPPRRFFGMAG